jgi:DNA-binding response OmpR family regulator
MHVLIIEDNPVLGRGIETALARWTHTSEWARDGDAGLALILAAAFDLVLLDLGLPRRNGLDVLREMRRHGVQTPVIVITARDDIGDRVGGLDAGADDYLVKPFHLDELAARLRALHRRAHGLAHRLIEVGRLRLDTMSSEASYQENPLDLSRMEFVVLRALAERAGRVVTRSALEQAMYGTGGVESNALEVHIHALRRKLAPEAIRTVRGLGYLLVREGHE